MVVPFFFFAYLDELIVTTSRDAHAIAIGTDAHVCSVLCEFRLWASAPLTSTHTHTHNNQQNTIASIYTYICI